VTHTTVKLLRRTAPVRLTKTGSLLLDPPLEAKSVVTAATTSLTDVLVPGMSIVAPKAGEYLLVGTVELSNGNTEETTVSAYVNGVQITDSERAGMQHQHGAFPTTSSTMTVAVLARVISDGDVVDLRWRVTGDTATSRGRSMILQRVGC
jgi:hypothetical protein